MKKQKGYYAILLLFTLTTTYAQELYVGSGGVVNVSSGDYLYINNNLSVDASGSLSLASDASSSASLLVTGTSSGNVTYVRNINNTNWHLVSSPVVGQSIPTFVADANNSINTNPGNGNFAVAYYKNTNASGSRWVYHNASPSQANQETLVSFVKGQGYSMNRTASGDFTFTGTLEVSDVNVGLSTSAETHYWYCIGNPYAAFLPGNDGANATNNLLKDNLSALATEFAALYYWDGGGGPTGGYKLINNATAATHLHPGQAFMVMAKTTSETFSFTSALQSHQAGGDNFYKSENSTPTVVISLGNGNQNFTTVVKYLPGATTGLDVGYDAGRYSDGVPKFSIDTHLVTDSQGTDFMLQCLPNHDYDAMIIPLSVRAAINSEITFNATTTNLPSGVAVNLQDTETNIYKKISEEPYSIQLTQELNGIGRFYIQTTQKALHVPHESDLSISIFKTDNENIRITGIQNKKMLSFWMFSIAGETLVQKKLNGSGLNEIDVSLPKSLSTGIYLIKIASESGVFVKKIVIE